MIAKLKIDTAAALASRVCESHGKGLSVPLITSETILAVVATYAEDEDFEILFDALVVSAKGEVRHG